MVKITIIGAGSVGATIAYTIAATSLASEVVLIDVNKDKALGEALDIRQGIPFCGAASVYAGSYYDAKDSDIVVLTSGLARKAGQSRLDLAQTNIDITKSIIPEITKVAPNAMYIIVSNPVDILTYTFYKRADINPNHIMGSGTILDTSRLRARIAEYYSLNQQNIHAYVFGEHGDTSFIPWSLATIANVPLERFHDVQSGGSRKDLPEFDHDEIEQYVRESGAKVISRKGATFYAIALAVCNICKRIIQGADTTLTLSTMMNGEYGISDVCLSTISILGHDGLDGKIISPLTSEEEDKLRKSAKALKDVIHHVTI